MIFNFDTQNEESAIGAFLVYVVWRSRDHKRFKITPDVWGQVERAVKSIAKRAEDLSEFLEKLKPRLMCSSLKPAFCKTVLDNVITMQRMPDGSMVEIADLGRREFLTDILKDADDKAVLDTLYRKTAYIILLVRDRVEREKVIDIDAITGSMEETGDTDAF